jgi:hypothetical protein
MDIISSMELVVNEVSQGVLSRRKIRNLLHRIRTSRVFDTWAQERAPGVKMIFEPQFRKVIVDETKGRTEIMSWKNFTYLWDVNPVHPLVVITAKEWVHAGGTYEKPKIDKRGKVFPGRCIPTAFTQQPL